MSARATSAPKWRLTASSSSAKRPVLCRRERASVSDKPRVLTLSKVLLALGVLEADRAVLQELVVGHPERLVDLGDEDRKSTRLNSRTQCATRMPSSA